jgi:hypothetical protein
MEITEKKRYVLVGGWPEKEIDIVDVDELEGKPTDPDIHLVYDPADGSGNGVFIHSKLLKLNGYKAVPREIYLELQVIPRQDSAKV